MNLREQCELILKFAQVLQANGQSTDDTLAATERLSNMLGLRTTLIPSWDGLQLEATDREARLVSLVSASPTAVQMERVASAMRAIDEIKTGQLPASAALEKITAISHAPPASTWLFTVAASTGAAALSLLFGVQHLMSVMLIVISAAGGAILRRALTPYSTNPLLQPFCAALLAGIIGALAVRYQVSSSLRLIAVCPCMILVPGPHVLNGMMDLIVARIDLAASRLLYAGTVVLAISAGLLLGLSLLGVSLPVGEPGRAVPLWLDIIAAGLAVAAYSIFFSMPLRTLAWPVAVGMAAHALRWFTLALGGGAAAGGFIACLVVGLILAPVAHHRHMPFAAIGFASVVSMMPGVFLFRMASGLLQLVNSANATLNLLGATIADGMTAVTIILAMTFGVVAPKIFLDRLPNRVRRSKSLEGKDANVYGNEGVASLGGTINSKL
jgi:uncharacterized membrane protein YjjP (DUF1212 family)